MIGMRMVLGMVALVGPAAAMAQAGNPADTTPSGPMVGSLPNKQTTETAAAVRGSATDVTAVRERGSADAPTMAALSARRRNDAMVLAAKVRGGAAVPDSYVKPLIEAIDGDLTLWREAYKVPGKEYRAARKRWLDTDPPANANGWALRRAEVQAELERWEAGRADRLDRP